MGKWERSVTGSEHSKVEAQQAFRTAQLQADTNLLLFHDLTSARPQEQDTQPTRKKTEPLMHVRRPPPLTSQNQLEERVPPDQEQYFPA
jgi:hypothetical protein